MTRRITIGVLLVAAVVIGGAVAISVLLEATDATPPMTPAAATTFAPLPPVVATTSPTNSGVVPVAPTTTVRLGLPIPLADEPRPEPPPPDAANSDGFIGAGVVTVAAGGADLAAVPGGPTLVRAREGLVFPASALEGEWVRILTTCDDEAWLNLSEVLTEPRAAGVDPGAGTNFADAVIVVDAGHGGPNIGTSSPDGSLPEKVVNVDIARRLRDLLERSHTIDWETGVLYEGDAVPAVRRVIMTRVGADESADYEAGLVYRASLANAAGADVLMSIHNNAGWEIELDHPGSDVFYQSQLDGSRRLAELLVEEFQRGLSPFDADWVGAIEWGAKSRLSPRDEVSQYYGILRRAEMPAVIAEGAYLANASEARLLATPAFRQAYAEAAYRAIVRFLTTDEVAAAPSYDPVVWAGFAGSGDPVDTCEVPAQGE